MRAPARATTLTATVAAFASIVGIDAARSAHACICPMEPSFVVVPGPHPGSAPLDTHVFVTARDGWEHEPICPEVADPEGPTPACATGDFRLQLRAAATPTSAATEVAFDTRIAASSGKGEPFRAYLELAPKAHLSPNTRYEVVLVEAKKLRPARVVGTFSTGAQEDHDAPTWAGITAATVHLPELDAWGKPKTSPCDAPALFAELRIAPPVDASPVLFAVWTSASGAAIDYAKTPQALVRADAGVLRIGELRCEGLVAPLAPAKGVRVGVRPIDVAGHLGTTSEVTFDAVKSTTQG